MLPRKSVQTTKKRIAELERELQILKCTKPRVVADDPYEFLLMCDLLNMDAKIREVLEAAPFKLTNKSATDYTFRRLLDQFPGRTVKEQKEALRKFLVDHPALRTLNIELLLQRVYIWNHCHDFFEERSLPERPIQEVLDEHPIPIEEPPELPEE